MGFEGNELKLEII